MTRTPQRIRKAWAVLLAYCILTFVGGLYPYLTLTAAVRPAQLAQVAVDAVAIYGLAGFVLRRPVRQIALRLLFRVIALVFVARAVVVARLVSPNLTPWGSTREQLVSLLLIATLPLALLVAVALWRHSFADRATPERKEDSTIR